MEKNKYEIQYDKLNLVKMNIYDEVFPQNIRVNASIINLKHNLNPIQEIDNNTYETVVHGTYDYTVRVQLGDDLSLKKCSCECPYYMNTDTHCKHVYALLTEIIQEKNNPIIQSKYDENISLLENNVNKLGELIEENKNKVNDGFLGSWINSVYEKMNNDLKDSKGIILSGMSERDSHLALNHSLSVLDESTEELNKVEESLSDYYKKNSNDNEETTTTYTFDDSFVFDAIDEKLAQMPIEVLRKAKEENIKNGESTEIIDKAINERTKRDEKVKKEQEEIKRATRRGIMGGILSGLFSSNKSKSKTEDIPYLMSWEQDEVNKGNYTPDQFEEEEMDEDDYYSNDDKE